MPSALRFRVLPPFRRPLVLSVVLVALVLVGSDDGIDLSGGYRMSSSTPREVTSKWAERAKEVGALECGPQTPCTFPTASRLGISASVDGEPISERTIDHNIQGAWQGASMKGLLPRTDGNPDSATANSVDPSDPNVVARAIASALFDRLLLLETERRGITVSEEEVRQFAQSQLAAYQQTPIPGFLQAGEDASSYFLSDKTAIGYRLLILASKGRAAITQGQPKNADVSALMTQWMRGALSTHDVEVAGLPAGVTLDALPDALFSFAFE